MSASPSAGAGSLTGSPKRPSCRHSIPARSSARGDGVAALALEVVAQQYGPLRPRPGLPAGLEPGVVDGLAQACDLDVERRGLDPAPHPVVEHDDRPHHAGHLRRDVQGELAPVADEHLAGAGEALGQGVGADLVLDEDRVAGLGQRPGAADHDPVLLEALRHVARVVGEGVHVVPQVLELPGHGGQVGHGAARRIEVIGPEDEPHGAHPSRGGPRMTGSARMIASPRT